MLIDTDVLIWYLRGNKKASETIKKQGEFSISVITYMELIQGMRNKKELGLLRSSLNQWKTKVIYINENISMKALLYLERHFLSHSMELADALIAATASINNLTILTGNEKHYRTIKDLKVSKFSVEG